MKIKYGSIPDSQFEDFRKRLHAWVHWCFFYAEKQDPKLDHYFEKIQKKILGFNELLNCSDMVIELMTVLEAARFEYSQAQHKTETYRQFILNAHEIIDRL